MGNLKLARSPLTNDIYCGSVIKGNLWGKNKTEITADAIFMVLDHAIEFEKRSGEKLHVTDGKRKWTFNIVVEDVEPKGEEL